LKTRPTKQLETSAQLYQILRHFGIVQHHGLPF